MLILVDDVPSLLPPQGFADISTTKNISIKIIDSGVGMNEDFLVYDYFRPMSKGVSSTRVNGTQQSILIDVRVFEE